MKTLALQEGIFDEIVRLAHLYGELEFAVTIFGFIRDERFEVTHIAQPGPGSKHEYGRCTGDHEFESDFFNDLRKTEPGIRWLGDLHAHPPSYPRLSGTDHRTIQQILFGTDDTLHPEEYVAGIILPLRRAGEPGVAIVPIYFSKVNPSGSEMELEYVTNGIRTKPKRARHLFLAAYGHRWSWHDRWRARRHPRPDGGGGTHAN